MTPAALANDARGAAAAGTNMTLVLPRCFKRPPGFPRGELLSETERGRVYSFKPERVLRWVGGIVAAARGVAWICFGCARDLGATMHPEHLCTVHRDICGVCHVEKEVTEPRDFRWPA